MVVSLQNEYYTKYLKIIKLLTRFNMDYKLSTNGKHYFFLISYKGEPKKNSLWIHDLEQLTSLVNKTKYFARILT